MFLHNHTAPLDFMIVTTISFFFSPSVEVSLIYFSLPAPLNPVLHPSSNLRIPWIQSFNNHVFFILKNGWFKVRSNEGWKEDLLTNIKHKKASFSVHWLHSTFVSGPKCHLFLFPLHLLVHFFWVWKTLNISSIFSIHIHVSILWIVFKDKFQPCCNRCILFRDQLIIHSIISSYNCKENEVETSHIFSSGDHMQANLNLSFHFWVPVKTFPRILIPSCSRMHRIRECDHVSTSFVRNQNFGLDWKEISLILFIIEKRRVKIAVLRTLSFINTTRVKIK